MKRLTLCLISLLFFRSLSAQTEFLQSSDAYLGQPVPGDTPIRFAPQLLVPDTGFSMGRSAFSNDDKEFYYVRGLSWFSANGLEIRYFRFSDHTWKGPFLLNSYFNTPTFSMDGNMMYFLGGPRDTAYSNVWYSKRQDTGWSAPLIYLKKLYGLYNFMPTRSGTMYVASNVHSGKRRDFTDYDFSTLSIHGADTTVKSLGTPLNTPGFDGDFYIAPDESYMIVSYHEKPDYESELGISFRKPDHTWTAPQSLGPLINNGDAHRWGAYVSHDGKYMFYSHGTSEKDCALYWVRFDTLLEKLRKTAF